jgi:hypothetical protein
MYKPINKKAKKNCSLLEIITHYLLEKENDPRGNLQHRKFYPTPRPAYYSSYVKERKPRSSSGSASASAHVAVRRLATRCQETCHDVTTRRASARTAGPQPRPANAFGCASFSCLTVEGVVVRIAHFALSHCASI